MLSPPVPLVDFASKCLASLALTQTREAEIHTRQGIIKHAPAESAGGLGMLSPQETRTPAGARISCGECPCRPRGSALGSIQNGPSPLAGGDDPDLRRAHLPDGHRPLPFFDSGTPWLAGERGLPAPLPWKGTPHPWRCSLLGGVGKQPYPFIGLGSLPPARRHGPHDSRTGSHSERSPGNVARPQTPTNKRGLPHPKTVREAPCQRSARLVRGRGPRARCSPLSPTG